MVGKDGMAAPEFVALGHVTFDVRVDAGPERSAPEPGGPSAYAGLTAAALGLDAGIVTCASSDYDFETLLPGVQVVVRRSHATTVFRYSNQYGGRTQWLQSRACGINRSDVPEDWLDAPIALLGPVAGELPANAAGWFSPDTFVCAVPQGWQRTSSPDGLVNVSPQPPAGLGSRIDAIVISGADVPRRAWPKWTEAAPIVAVTQGRSGATLFVNGEPALIPAQAASEIDSTGAGDVWAASFAVRYVESGDPVASATFAAGLAALSVQAQGLAGIPTRKNVKAGQTYIS